MSPAHSIGATLALAVAFTLAVATSESAAADFLLRCSTNEVVMTSAPSGETAARRRVDLTFRINDAARTIALGEASLVTSRFDRNRIIAEHDQVIYDFDRQNHALNYAGSRSSGATVTTIVGSGPCAIKPRQHPSSGKSPSAIARIGLGALLTVDGCGPLGIDPRQSFPAPCSICIAPDAPGTPSTRGLRSARRRSTDRGSEKRPGRGRLCTDSTWSFRVKPKNS